MGLQLSHDASDVEMRTLAGSLFHSFGAAIWKACTSPNRSFYVGLYSLISFAPRVRSSRHCLFNSRDR